MFFDSVQLFYMYTEVLCYCFRSLLLKTHQLPISAFTVAFHWMGVSSELLSRLICIEQMVVFCSPRPSGWFFVVLGNRR